MEVVTKAVLFRFILIRFGPSRFPDGTSRLGKVFIKSSYIHFLQEINVLITLYVKMINMQNSKIT